MLSLFSCYTLTALSTVLYSCYKRYCSGGQHFALSTQLLLHTYGLSDLQYFCYATYVTLHNVTPNGLLLKYTVLSTLYFLSIWKGALLLKLAAPSTLLQPFSTLPELETFSVRPTSVQDPRTPA